MVFHVEITTLLRVLQLPRFMAKQDIDATLEAHEKEQTISFEKPRYTVYIYTMKSLLSV